MNERLGQQAQPRVAWRSAHTGWRPTEWLAMALCVASYTVCSCIADSAVAESIPAVHRHEPQPAYKTDGRFQTALKRRISTSWSNVTVRDALRGIVESQQIAILLDRRIDPSQMLNLDVDYRPVLQVVKAVADKIAADVSVVGNTVYIGPPRAASQLRTLVALRSAELFDESARVPDGRKFELEQQRSIRWEDLDAPADIMNTIAARSRLNIQNPEVVPHDLWAGTTLPVASASEAFQLLLIQFDLTFEWTEAAQGIRIVPVPETVLIDKLYSPTPRLTTEILDTWRKTLPSAQLDLSGQQVRLRGTIEQHEALAELLRPAKKPSRKRVPDADSLANQRFTLRIKGVAALAVIRKLEQTGTTFEYDEESLQAAGIDLTTTIDIDVQMADAETFFHALFDPLNVAFSIEDDTVILSPP